MKHRHLILVIIFLFPILINTFGQDRASKKPNIVLIYADDQGWKDIGYQSGGDFKTPVLDSLAQQGMVFTNAYSNAANCQPARACLLSGNYTPRHHVFAVSSTSRGPKNYMRLISIPNRDGLNEEDITIADALKTAGYATGHFGKWHLYDKGGMQSKGGGGALPSKQGFDVTYDSFGEGELPEGHEGNARGPSSDPKGVFDLSKQACDFMEVNKDKPFFVYLAHHAPHSPLNSRESTRKMIKDPYKACIYDLDASVGLVLAKIKDLGLEKNTLVIYTSDNGGQVPKEPLRGKKGMYYEGGIREPMIARWPGVIKAGSTCSTPVMQIDYFPTFMELAGVQIDKPIDGESLAPLLTQSGELNRKSLYWHFPGYLNRPGPGGRDTIFRARPVSVIRKGNWKLKLYFEEWVLDGGMSRIAKNNSVELFNLESDPGEQINLALKNPEIRDALLAELLAWHEKTDAPIPTEKNPAYNPEKTEINRPEQQNHKPNVIYILTDDLGYGDLSCYGQYKIQTPNIDRLAEEGIKFTDFYAGNTVCSPSRFCLMTGQHPGHATCRGNSGGKKELNPQMTTLANVFKNAGYATGMYGKWGLGNTCSDTDANPLRHGFDEFYCWETQGAAHTYYPLHMVENGKKIRILQGTYVHDVIVDKAFTFIRKNAEEHNPFFCYMPVAVPHAAMHAPSELHNKWRKEFPEFDDKIGKYGAGEEPCPEVVNPIAGFAAMMENLDNQVGELLSLLKMLNIDENTIVVFTSDNGCHREGGHDSEFWNSNGPLRGNKRDLYEGGIRVPGIVRWPAVVKPGTITDFISTAWDILPTMTDILNQPQPEQCDGISLLPVLQGRECLQPEYRYWEFWSVLPKGARTKEFRDKQGITSQAVRSGKWKAFRGYSNENKENFHLKPDATECKIELYDLERDIGEKNNVADQYPEIVEKMMRYMQEAHVPPNVNAGKNNEKK